MLLQFLQNNQGVAPCPACRQNCVYFNQNRLAQACALSIQGKADFQSLK